MEGRKKERREGRKEGRKRRKVTEGSINIQKPNIILILANKN